jgi:cytosine/uracil/thiamine/allantoin permease
MAPDEIRRFDGISTTAVILFMIAFMAWSIGLQATSTYSQKNETQIEPDVNVFIIILAVCTSVFKTKCLPRPGVQELSLRLFKTQFVLI